MPDGIYRKAGELERILRFSKEFLSVVKEQERGESGRRYNNVVLGPPKGERRYVYQATSSMLLL